MSSIREGSAWDKGVEASPDAALGGALLRPVRSHHAFEACVEQLAMAIRLGGYSNGATLPTERELSARLGVSRATLREAIAALREAGFIETRRGRGGGNIVRFRPDLPGQGNAASVLALPRQQMLDALSFRRIVEPGSAFQAAARVAGDELAAEDRAALTEALDDVHTAKDDPARRRLADSRLHLAIAKTAGSRLLLDAVTVVQSRLHEMLIAIPVLAPNIDHSDLQHEQIISAILSGHPELAHQAMEEHCDDTSALLRGLLS